MSDYTKNEFLARDRAYSEAVDFLAHAKVAAEKTTDRAALESLREAKALANKIIGQSFKASNVVQTGMKTIEEMYSEHEIKAGLPKKEK